jgi:nucleoside 2-deoxyribosyltransferase
MDHLCIYISIPIRYHQAAATIEQALQRTGARVLNPCHLVPDDCAKDELPAFFAHACYRMIDDADAVVLFANYYGRDCATEIGYAIHAGTPVFPVVLDQHASDHLTVDWMIRPLVQPLSRGLDELLSHLESRPPRRSKERAD